MAEVKYNVCDIKGCDNRATCIKTSLQVIFRTEQTEGRASTPYLQNVSLEDTNPIDLAKFMVDNKITSDAYFRADSDGRVYLAFAESVLTTSDDTLEYLRTRFSNAAFTNVYRDLTQNGYKRVGFSSEKLSKFRNFFVYDSFKNRDYDIIVEYYSLYFQPIS